MPRVQYGGQIHEFPDSFSDEDIKSALESVKTPVEVQRVAKAPVEVQRVAETPVEVPATATAMSAAGVDPEVAARSLDLSRKAGLSPDFISKNLDPVAKNDETAEFARQLDGRPALKAWADRSASHAASVKRDAAPLGRIEGWLTGLGDSLRAEFAREERVRLSDIGDAAYQGVVDIFQAEAAREYTQPEGGPLADSLQGAEAETTLYDAKPRAFVEKLARAAPQMVLYGAATVFGGPLGLAAALYAQNRGVLARRLQQARSDTEAQLVREAVEAGQPIPDLEKVSMSDADIFKFAHNASIAVAATGPLLDPILRSIPGIRELAGQVMVRAAAKPAVQTLLAYGGHTTSGALAMALQKSINDETVTKATTGQFQDGAVARLFENFMDAVPIAAAFGAYGPARELMAERGRIDGARVDTAALDDQVAQAKKSALVINHPAQARELIDGMSPGASVYIGHEALPALRDVLPAGQVADAEASQGSVRVTAGQYLAEIAPNHHETIRDHVKLEADGYTPAEARATLANMVEVLTPEQARALYGSMPDDPLFGKSLPAAGDLTPEQVKKLEASFNPKEAAPTTPGRGQQRVPQQLELALSEAYGGKPEEWAALPLDKLLETAPPGVDIKAHAARTVEALPLKEIRPEVYSRLVDMANRRIEAAMEKSVSGPPAGVRPPGENQSLGNILKLATMEQARDLNAAKANHATTVVEKYAKARATVADRVESNRELFRKADAARGTIGFQDVFNGLMEALGVTEAKGEVAGTFPTPELAFHSLPDVVDRMRGSNTPVTFDFTNISKILAKGTKWESLTPSEADHVQVALKNLRRGAKNEISVAREDLNTAAAQVSLDAMHLPKKSEPLVPGAASWWQRVTRYPAAFNARALERIEILKSLGPTVKRLLVDRYYAAAEMEDQLSRDVLGKYDKALGEMPKEMKSKRFDAVEMPRELSEAYRRVGLEPNPDRKFLWTVGMMWGDGQARMRYTRGLGVPEALVNDWLVRNIKPQEWKFIAELGGLHEGLWDALRAKEERKSGVAPEKSIPAPIYDLEGNQIAAGWYFPLGRDRRAFTADGGVQRESGPGSVADFFGPSYTRPAVQHRFIKERAAQAAYIVDLNWDKIPSHLGQVIRDIAFDPMVTDAAKLLLHPVVDDTMKERLGMEKRDQVRAWLYVVANERAEVADGLGLVGKVLTFLRNRTQSYALGNSIPVISAIATHSLVSLAHREVRALAAVDYIKALSPSVRKFAIENSEALRQRESSGKRALQDDMRLLGDRIRDSYLGKGLELAARIAQFGQDFMDQTMGVGLFMGKYNEVLAKGGTHEAAKAAGNDMIRANLQPRAPAERSMLMNERGMLSAILIFHGFFNKVYNKAAEFMGPAADAWSTRTPMPDDVTPGDAFAEAQAKRASEDRAAAAWKTAEASGKFLALLGVLSAGKLALGHGREEGEKWWQWGLRHMLGAAADLIPFLSNVTQPILDKLISGHARPVDFRAAPALAGLQKGVRLVQGAVNDTKSDKLWKAVDAMVLLTGAGSAQYVRTAKYLTGPRSSRDLSRWRIGSYLHGTTYGEQNKSETLPLLIEHLIGGQ